MATKVIHCNCPSAFQDGKYGKNMRVANLTEDGRKARCTVCGKEHTV